ncbi:MAG: ABC transporter ATP-binding protein [Bdellovibrionota bacterium]
MDEVGQVSESAAEVVLEANNLVQRFDTLRVLSNVHLQLFRGEIVGLIGPSGGGKSVLLKTLANVLQPTEGDVHHFLGECGAVSFMFQEGALFDSVSVLDNVAFPLIGGRVPCSNLKEEEKARVSQLVGAILEKVGLFRHGHKFPAQLSGGMRRRVSLARALVNEPEIALLDDPTSGLDPVASSVIMALIKSLHKSLGTSMVLVSHDLRRLLPVCSRIVGLFDGKIVFDGTLDALRTDANEEVRHFVSCRYDLDAAA